MSTLIGMLVLAAVAGAARGGPGALHGCVFSMLPQSGVLLNDDPLAAPEAVLPVRRMPKRVPHPKNRRHTKPWTLPPNIAKMVLPKKQRFPTSTTANPVGFEELLKAQKAKVQETYYEPYAKDGEWVFSRLDQLYTWPTPKTAPGGTAPATNAIPDTANKYCGKLMKSYGPLCANRCNYQTWEHEYKSFDSYCDMEDANFKERMERKGWKPVHTGACQMDTPFHLQLTTKELVIENVISLIEYIYPSTRKITNEKFYLRLSHLL